MFTTVLIHCITGTDLHGARAEGKLRVLNISGEPGPGPRPDGSAEKVLVAAVQNAASVDEALSLMAAETFDLVLIGMDEIEIGDLTKLNNVCKEEETPLIRWRSEMEGLESEEGTKRLFRDSLIGIDKMDSDVGTESARLRKDGPKSYVQETAQAAKGPDGRRHNYEGMVQEVTGNRLAEAALRENKERFQALVESIGDFIWELDAGGTYVYVSPQVELPQPG